MPYDLYDPQGMIVDGYRVIWRHWDFGEADDFLNDLADVRKEFKLKNDAPLWIVDGGFFTGIDAQLRQRLPGVALTAHRDFDGALTIFQIPAGI